MKKIFTLLAALCCTLGGFAQALVITQNGKVLEDGAVVGVEEVPLMWGMLDPALMIKNNSDQEQEVVVMLTNLSSKNLANEQVSICWPSQCQTVAKESSLKAGPSQIKAQAEQSLRIEGSLADTSAPGTATVKIEAWTEGNPAEKTTVTVTFTNDAEVLASIANTTLQNGISVSGTQLSYHFGDDAQRILQLFNVAGKQVKSLALSNQTGSLSLDDMPKGLYLYRVTENGKQAATKKIMIK